MKLRPMRKNPQRRNETRIETSGEADENSRVAVLVSPLFLCSLLPAFGSSGFACRLQFPADVRKREDDDASRAMSRVLIDDDDDDDDAFARPGSFLAVGKAHLHINICKKCICI
jgi:hypothetical protein